MEQRLKDDGRPRCGCGRLPKKASRSRFYCPSCRRYVTEGTRATFVPAAGFENFALYALTGHFPRVAA